MAIAQELQSTAPGTIVEMFEVDTTPIEPATPNIYRFHPGLSMSNTEVSWQGRNFYKYPVESSGYEWTGKGALPKPVLRIANIQGLISSLNRTKQDLVGAKVIRKRTFHKYLDEVNHTRAMALIKPQQATNIANISDYTVKGTAAVIATSVFTNAPLPLTGKYFWEATLETIGTFISIGIAHTGNSIRYANRWPGIDALSYGLRTISGNWYNNNTVVAVPTTPILAGTVIGMFWDADNKILKVLRDGVLIHTQTIIPPANSYTYPVFGFQGASFFRVNFGALPYTYPIDSTSHAYRLPHQGGYHRLNRDTNMPIELANPTILASSTDNRLARSGAYAGWTYRPVGPKLYRGKYYFEAVVDLPVPGTIVPCTVMLGVANNLFVPTTTAAYLDANAWMLNGLDGFVYNTGASLGGAATTFNKGDVIGVAIDITNQSISWYKNGVVAPIKTQAIVVPVSGYVIPYMDWNELIVSLTFNFGNTTAGTSFTYDPPLGFQPLPLTENQNISTDTQVSMPDEYYFINRKVNENRIAVEYELSSSLDLQGIKLPRRQILKDVCTWAYRGPECTYVGIDVEDIFGQAINPATGLSINNLPDACSKSIDGCKKRFIPPATLPYGGFPGSTLV